MIAMVQNINKTSFGGRQVVTCWTCHRGQLSPSVTPPLDFAYGEAVVNPPDLLARDPNATKTVDQIFDKFIQAEGGAARLNAHAAFSHFLVGAALQTPAGRIITGCNIENATYGLTICAERVALFKAISEGERQFTRIVVVADTSEPTPPCGACRQILWEFGGDLQLTLANLTSEKGTHQLRDLLPLPFDARLL